MASVQDYAVLSAYVYNDARGDVNQISISSDWQPIGDGISNNPSGFSANAFQNGNEIVIAFKRIKGVSIELFFATNQTDNKPCHAAHALS